MPVKKFLIRFVCSMTMPLAISLAVLTMPANAGNLYGEQVHADSFGNLIIYSSSGYKRIVVGKGYLADEMASDHEPRVVYLDDGYAIKNMRPCERQGVLLHGRSYMYGLPDNVTPVLSACR